MEILYNINTDIVNLIENKAKYQKVLLIYDNTISEFEINLLFSRIKDLCIFNKMEINSINEKEIFNGYKILIFMCSGNSLINLKFNRNEFINIYIPSDNIILPFYVNLNNILNNNCYLILNNNFYDTNLIPSIKLNQFLYGFNCLLNNNNKNFTNLIDDEIINFSTLKNISNINEDITFLDLEIIAHCSLNYSDLWLVDLLLINAFILLFSAIKNNKLNLIDVYKYHKDDLAYINNLFMFINDDNFFNIVKNNYNYLLGTLNNIKQNILKNNFSIITKQKINFIINKLKNYSKNCNNYIFYLYIYNILNI